MKKIFNSIILVFILSFGVTSVTANEVKPQVQQVQKVKQVQKVQQVKKPTVWQLSKKMKGNQYRNLAILIFFNYYVFDLILVLLGIVVLKRF